MADDLGDEWWKTGSDPESLSDENEDNMDSVVSRKRDHEAMTDPSEEPAQKKKKKRKRRKITEYLEEKGEQSGSNHDFIQFLKKEYGDKLSPVEMDEINLSLDEHFFEANTSAGFPVAYLKTVCPKWKKQKAAHTGEGSPIVLILTSSAIRAVELNRQIQDFKGDNCTCAKLFAKHMKVKDQEKYLKKKVCHLGLGTPSRASTLLQTGHLKLDKLTAVIIDWNWRDIKKKRLVDIPDIRSEMAAILKSYLIPHIKKQSSCKIGIL